MTARSALILAGGKGSRLGYREKALLDIGGKPLLSAVIESLRSTVSTIIISVRDRAQAELLRPVAPGCRFAYDAYRDVGPLAGILAGLEACEDEYCFVAACDMPFINENVVKMLFEKSEGHDAAIPRWEDGFLEPLHAVYRCRPMVRETKEALGKGETIILAPVFKLNVNYVAVDEIKKLDPSLRTFININTCTDMRRITGTEK